MEKQRMMFGELYELNESNDYCRVPVLWEKPDARRHIDQISADIIARMERKGIQLTVENAQQILDYQKQLVQEKEEMER